MIFEKQFVSSAKAENIIINLNPLLNVELRIEPWSKELRYYRKNNKNWNKEKAEIGFPIVTSCYENEADHPFNSFIGRIPYNIRKSVISIHHLQYSLLTVIAKYQYARQLSVENIILLWLLVIYISEHKLNIKEIEKYFLLRRRTIINKILNIGDEKHVKFLQKIKLFKGDEFEARIITSCLSKRDIVNRFSFFEKIPIQSLYILQKYPSLIETNLLDYFSSLKFDMIEGYINPPSKIIQLIEDTINLGNQLGFKNVHSIVNSANSPERLKIIHDNWVELLNERANLLADDEELPSVPISGNDHIIPIRSANELIQEGINMKHCLATYLDKVMDGKSFIYKVVFPERATLELRKKQNKYFVAQLKRERNAEPSDATWELVNNWLKIAQP